MIPSAHFPRDFDHCECSFDLLSVKPFPKRNTWSDPEFGGMSEYKIRYTAEHYEKVPCDLAQEFLFQLDAGLFSYSRAKPLYSHTQILNSIHQVDNLRIAERGCPEFNSDQILTTSKAGALVQLYLRSSGHHMPTKTKLSNKV